MYLYHQSGHAMSIQYEDDTRAYAKRKIFHSNLKVLFEIFRQSHFLLEKGELSYRAKLRDP
jgi:hypothetical protein